MRRGGILPGALPTALLAASVALAATFVVGCKSSQAEPEAQVVLHLTTDAPLPPEPGASTNNDEPPALFDRVVFEIFPPGESAPCTGCARDFALDRTTVAAGRASIGAAYQPGASGYRARIRLYRSSFRERFGPRPASTLEAVVALPELPATGVVDVGVSLRIDDLGVTRGTLDAPLPVQGGVPSPLPPWPRAARVPCAAPPPAGMACVPGGAFWMGDPALASLADFSLADVSLTGTEERLVVLAPFYVDLHEATVADIRASGLARRDAAGRFVDPVERDPASSPGCTLTHAPETLEQHPANCLTWALAESFCRARGAELPTEARLEYLLGGTLGRPWVWGFDPPTCDDATAERNEAARDDGTSCIGSGVGSDEIGRGRRDRLPLSGGLVVDIAGSVSELARDVFSLVGEGYWGPGLFIDPLGTVPGLSVPGSHSMRGGNFDQQRGLMRSGIRQFFADGTTDPAVGFRCVLTP